MNVEIKFNGQSIFVQEEIALSLSKEIQKNIWRAKRKLLFEKLDIDFMKAIEADSKDKINSIAEMKNKLRDVTNTQMPNTIEETMEFWPDLLKY